MLYDAEGRLVIGLSDTYVRTKNGKLQLKNISDDLWYDLILQNDAETGNPVLGVSNSGEGE
jgi:hypothetical protein